MSNKWFIQEGLKDMEYSEVERSWDMNQDMLDDVFGWDIHSAWQNVLFMFSD